MSEDTIYSCKDGRLRVYVKKTGKTISYPKYLMEKELGRELTPDEVVHHKDENPLNNDISNLMIMSQRDHAAIHARKYYDTMATCDWCGKEFLWTGKQQQYFYSNQRNHSYGASRPFCSRACSGSYGRQVQMNSNLESESTKRKLTDEQVRYIREKYIPHDRNVGARALAKRFGVDKSVINFIINGRTYKDVT